MPQLIEFRYSKAILLRINCEGKELPLRITAAKRYLKFQMFIDFKGRTPSDKEYDMTYFGNDVLFTVKDLVGSWFRNRFNTNGEYKLPKFIFCLIISKKKMKCVFSVSLSSMIFFFF